MSFEGLLAIFNFVVSMKSVLLFRIQNEISLFPICIIETGIGQGPASPTRSSSSPKSPAPSSPTEVTQDETGRTLVRRSNSSPEMSDSWKPTFINQQHLIQEQEEDELSSPPSKAVLDCAVPEMNLNSHAPKLGEVSKQLERPTSLNSTSSHLSKGGSTSPYRRSYEAIPEEVLSQKETVQPLSVSPSKRERLHYQHSVDETGRSAAAFAGVGKEKEKDNVADLHPVKRDRMFTISVMSPAVRNKGLRRILSAGSGDSSVSTLNKRDFESRSGATESSSIRSGMSPSFVFLQLCSQGFFGSGPKPQLIPTAMEKSLKVNSC
jgi:hypothetical protein